jgi:hypothetical protein
MIRGTCALYKWIYMVTWKWPTIVDSISCNCLLWEGGMIQRLWSLNRSDVTIHRFKYGDRIGTLKSSQHFHCFLNRCFLHFPFCVLQWFLSFLKLRCEWWSSVSKKRKKMGWWGGEEEIEGVRRECEPVLCRISAWQNSILVTLFLIVDVHGPFNRRNNPTINWTPGGRKCFRLGNLPMKICWLEKPGNQSSMLFIQQPKSLKFNSLILSFSPENCGPNNGPSTFCGGSHTFWVHPRPLNLFSANVCFGFN